MGCFFYKYNMKKKIAVFTTGWCCEILTQFLTGLQESLKEEKADIFLFLLELFLLLFKNEERVIEVLVVSDHFLH